jgi:hypothetical protein
MLVKRKKPRDDVPTLNDLVEEPEAPPQAGSREEGPRAAAPTASPSPASGENQARSRSAFEVTVEAMVAEILNRHMASARDEITRSVLAEVRARLAGNRDKGGRSDTQ